MPYEIYVDDGYSGLNFERPSFQRMIDDVAVGKIGVVVVKDLSRFGRDHIVVGQYQEIYFPSKKVRFIALNDGIDTVNSHTTDYAALKNVINEFYSRDTSGRSRQPFVRGQRMASITPKPHRSGISKTRMTITT